MAQIPKMQAEGTKRRKWYGGGGVGASSERAFRWDFAAIRILLVCHLDFAPKLFGLDTPLAKADTFRQTIRSPIRIRWDMSQFHSLLEKFSTFASCAPCAAVENFDAAELLNGIPYAVIRQSMSVQERRTKGIFFTDTQTAKKAAELLSDKIRSGARIIDPACGIGDLLIACACHLPLAPTLRDTLNEWSNRIYGIDIHQEFVQATKHRLIILARTLGGFDEYIQDIEGYFQNIRQGDFFDNLDVILNCGAIITNPPYRRITIEHPLPWTSGSVNQAAWFLDQIMATATTGTQISAILPEVLRCGTNYSRFRKRLGKIAHSDYIESLGLFDEWTNVDVFITRLIRDKPGSIWDHSEHDVTETVSDHFIIRVGTVVPHREEHKGQWFPYIHAKELPSWGKSYIPPRSRRYRGSVFHTPFVAIRRTSRPSDKQRAIGTIIHADKPVAVENHLIVAIPKNGSLKSCKELLAVLRNKNTNDYLNNTMRCRHLTTYAVRSIPWSTQHD